MAKKESNPLRDKMLNSSTKLVVGLHKDPELGVMVFRQPGFMSAMRLEEMGKIDRILFLLLNCLFQPVLGEDGEPLIGEDGQPLVGNPVFGAFDEEVLRTTDHPKDGWFVRVVGALGDFINEGKKASQAGKQSATG